MTEFKTGFSAEKIAHFCHQWQVKSLHVITNSPSAENDISAPTELLVAFASHANASLFDLAKMQVEANQILGIGVRLVSRGGIDASRNPFRIREVLHSLELIYES